MLNEKILIIDAHPVYSSKLESFLRGLTYSNIVMAKSGGEGLRQAQLHKPTLTIMSGMLPDYDTCRMIREIKESVESSKIIVQIGFMTEEPEIACLKEAGANQVLLRKEKDLQSLEEAIASLTSHT